MDHALRTISFIADIGDVLVVMVRRCPPVTSDTFTRHSQTKICCHVFETDDVCTFCVCERISLSVFLCVCVYRKDSCKCGVVWLWVVARFDFLLPCK